MSAHSWGTRERWARAPLEAQPPSLGAPARGAWLFPSVRAGMTGGASAQGPDLMTESFVSAASDPR